MEAALIFRIDEGAKTSMRGGVHANLSSTSETTIQVYENISIRSVSMAVDEFSASVRH
jgi:hypothetical protein